MLLSAATSPRSLISLPASTWHWGDSASSLKLKHRGYGDTLYIDEVFVKINGKQHYLWHAVDQDGEVVDVFLQDKRDGAAAKRFFKRLLRSHAGEPRKIVTDRLRSYGVAHRELIPDVNHVTSQYANNRAEQSHESTRARSATLQISRAGAAICHCTFCRAEFIQPGKASGQRSAFP